MPSLGRQIGMKRMHTYAKWTKGWVLPVIKFLSLSFKPTLLYSVLWCWGQDSTKHSEQSFSRWLCEAPPMEDAKRKLLGGQGKKRLAPYCDCFLLICCLFLSVLPQPHFCTLEVAAHSPTFAYKPHHTPSQRHHHQLSTALSVEVWGSAAQGTTSKLLKFHHFNLFPYSPSPGIDSCFLQFLPLQYLSVRFLLYQVFNN